MATRPILRKRGKRAYTLTVWLTDREAKRVIAFARQVKAGTIRIVRSRTSAK
jgi:hypothetical protein